MKIHTLHQDTLTLQSFIESQAAGASLSFLQIEHETNVVMNNRGTQLSDELIPSSGAMDWLLADLADLDL